MILRLLLSIVKGKYAGTVRKVSSRGDRGRAAGPEGRRGTAPSDVAEGDDQVPEHVRQDHRQDAAEARIEAGEYQEGRPATQGVRQALVEMISRLQADTGRDGERGAAAQRRDLGHGEGADDQLFVDGIDHG